MNKYSIEMEVRDNELDAQGIVNNSNYMIYLAHARHKHVDALGVNFDSYTKNQQKLVLLSCNIKFKNSLKANDKFIVTSIIKASEYPYQWLYQQEIKRLGDDKLILRGIFNSTCINEKAIDEDSRLFIPANIKSLLQ